MLKIDNFPYPIPIPAKIWGRSLWSRSVMLLSAKSEKVRLISCEIIFADFQPIWSRYLNVTDGRTDGRTTCLGNTALRVASRGKNDFDCRRNSPNVIVGLANPGRQTVPKPPSSGCKAPVVDVLVCGTQHVSMSADRSRQRPA